MPPLGDRPQDIPLLLLHLLRKARSDPDLGGRLFSQDGEPRVATALVAQLVRHTWSTHVRELHQLLWEALREARGRHLAPLARLERGPLPPAGAPEPVDPETLEDAVVLQVIDEHRGNITAAAEALGLSSRYALYRLLKRRGLR